MIFCLITEAVDSKWAGALNVYDMGVNFMMVMVMLLGWKGEKNLHEFAECGAGGDGDDSDDGDIYIMIMCLFVCHENDHFLYRL